MKKIFSILLILAMSVSLFGCVASPDAARIEEGATRRNAIKSGDNYFTRGGESEYTIVHSATIGNTERKAVTEFNDVMLNAIGEELPVVSDAGLEYSATAKVVSLGANAYSKSAGVTVDKDAVGSNGFHIETKGNSVFIIGGGPWGTVWGAYEFLEEQLGYEFIWDDELIFDSAKCQESKLISINMNDKPVWEWRIPGEGEAAKETNLRTKLRMVETSDGWTTNVHAGFNHNVFGSDEAYGYIPLMYRYEHPEWYNKGWETNGVNAPCFSRDPEGLSEQVMSVIKTLIADSGDNNSVNLNFTQIDGPVWCDCDACKAIISKYNNANAATQVYFMKHYLSPKLDAYVKANCPEKRVIVFMFAYWSTKDAPIPKNATPEQIEEMRLPDNCGVQYCTGFPNSDAVPQGGEKASAESWKKLTDNIAVYDYSTNFSSYLTYFEDSNKLQANNEYFANGGNAILYYNLGDYNNNNNSDWARLQLYLEGKLLWDNTLDVNALTENFFNNYYKEAAPYMLEWYYTYRAWSKINHPSASGGITFPLAQCKAYAKLYEKAFDAILKYKFSDPDLYKSLYDRINLETIVVRHSMLGAYQYAIDDLPAYAKAFKADCGYFGFQRATEASSLSDWFHAIGIGSY